MGSTVMKRDRNRIGSDDARRWVRMLRLGNPYAKSILSALANYVDETGCAFPGISTLSQDTDIAEDTIVSRLKWCESIGAIVMFKNWVDENGNRNREGRGRVTSTEVRLLLDVAPETIEAEAAAQSKPRRLRGAALRAHEARQSDDGDDVNGDGDSPRHGREQTEEISPRHGRELNSAGPGLAPDLPPPRADRREESRKEDSPPTPPGGGVVREISLEESVSETVPPWSDFEAAWREPILRQSRAQMVWASLSEDERKSAIRAVAGYRLWRASQARPPALTSAQTFLKERDAWPRFVEMAPAADGAVTQRKIAVVPRASREGLAVAALYALAGTPPPINSDGDFAIDFEITQQILALADSPHKRDWPVFDNRQQLGAWNNLVRVIGRTVHAGDHVVNQRFRTGADGQQEFIGNDLKWGFKTPWPWPPRKDGTITTGPPDVGLSTDDDLQELAKG